MEFGFPPRITPPTKPEDAARAKALDNKAKSAVYDKMNIDSQNDRLNLSPKAKLLSTLRTAYEKLPDNQVKVTDIKQKVADTGTPALTANEIVTGILQGTLFAAL